MSDQAKQMTEDEAAEFAEQVFDVARKGDAAMLAVAEMSELRGDERERKGVRSRRALLRGDMPAARIVLAGDGPLRNELSRLVSDLHLESTVSVLGHRSDVGDLLAASDLVVLPSLWEGLSISLLEAMAAGKPVVTTSIGSNREVTNDGEVAVLVPPKDAPSLAAAISVLAADGSRLQELGRKGQQIQRERYGLPRMLDAYMSEYDCLLGQQSVQAARRVQVERT